KHTNADLCSIGNYAVVRMRISSGHFALGATSTPSRLHRWLPRQGSELTKPGHWGDAVVGVAPDGPGRAHRPARAPVAWPAVEHEPDPRLATEDPTDFPAPPSAGLVNSPDWWTQTHSMRTALPRSKARPLTLYRSVKGPPARLPSSNTSSWDRAEATL